MEIFNETQFNEQSDVNHKELSIEPITVSGCKVTHMPTGLSVTINGRHFQKSKKKALKTLERKLKDEQRIEVSAKKREHRKYKTKYTETIRTYNRRDFDEID
jgi:protein subunit release factor A